MTGAAVPGTGPAAITEGGSGGRPAAVVEGSTAWTSHRMDVEVEIEDGVAVVRIVGEVDLEHSAAVRQHLLEALFASPAVIVDMAAVSMIDSSGVASLLEAYQTGRKRGRPFVLANVGESVARVFRLARLDTVFRIADDLDAARAVCR